MPILAAALCLACQPPAAGDDPVARLGIENEVAAVIAAWRQPPSRWASNAGTALAHQLRAHPLHAGPRAEAFVRDALAEIRPVPLLRAAARGLGHVCRERDPDLPARLDARGFEDILERAHREVVRALGSGRAPELIAPRLQALLERALSDASLPSASEEGRDAGKELCQRARDVDIAVLQEQAALVVRAALALVEGEGKTLAQAPTTPGTRGVSGGVVFDRTMPFGRLVIGGAGSNEYACDQLAVIVDLGGDDVYRGPAAGAGLVRQLSVVVDVAGDDVYEASNDALGSGTFGLGLLVDIAGNDRYRGRERCAGFGAGGLGALFDLAGDDDLTITRIGGGAGFLGLGLCLDVGAGKDKARAAAYAFGCGLACGLGLFVDDGGDDEREVRAGDALGHAAWGVGLGALGWLDGGAGLFVDVDGVDRYVAGDQACGAGSHGGVGVFFDTAGHDAYEVGRVALGSGRELGTGVFIDAAGDDSYRARGMALGSATQGGCGHAEDRAGQDLYELNEAWPAHAADGGWGTFLEHAGKDRYRVLGVATAPASTATVRATTRLALSVFEDRGGDADLYDATAGGRRGNDVNVRQGGDVVWVFVDR
jgi:hypothetical protein